MSSEFSEFNPNIAVTLDTGMKIMKLSEAQREYDRVTGPGEHGYEDTKLGAALSIAIATVNWPGTVEWYIALLKRVYNEQRSK